ncbi:diguanylate cyclase domain-containing protein [Microcoleus vaginatus]|uniref:diguanylate cyclase domain-containing protein n=1 Tax=Microcoleus vaginatus TaxID=119532 RepID=UPI004040B4C7
MPGRAYPYYSWIRGTRRDYLYKNIITNFILKNHSLHITTSIGISLYPQDGMNLDRLLKNADISLYYVKELGPIPIVFTQQQYLRPNLIPWRSQIS